MDSSRFGVLCFLFVTAISFLSLSEGSAFALDPECKAALSSAGPEANFEDMVDFFSTSLDDLGNYLHLEVKTNLNVSMASLSGRRGGTGSRETVGAFHDLSTTSVMVIQIADPVYDLHKRAKALIINAYQAYGVFKESLVVSNWHNINGLESAHAAALRETISEIESHTGAMNSMSRPLRAIQMDKTWIYLTDPLTLTLKVYRSLGSYAAILVFKKDPISGRIVQIDFEETILNDSDTVKMTHGSFQGLH